MPSGASPRGDDWRPAAALDALRRRAELLTATRAFFAARGVLEVETPQLSAATVTDPHLASLATRYRGPGAPGEGLELFLQTSPEYAMKRLLAAGSGPIYQLARAFRDGESGGRHNPEFTLLEWYRPGFDHHRLMDEMDELLAALLDARPAERLTYGDAFARALDLDPHRAEIPELRAVAARIGLGDVAGMEDAERDDWLALLLTHAVEPTLGRRDAGATPSPTYLLDYPASQAALARLRRRDDGVVVGERFEVYVDGIELANGFHELADAGEQRRRFLADLEQRRARGLAQPPLDERLLAALASGGFPACAGVALGFDRLVMLAVGARSIDEVLAFPIARA